MRNQWSVLGEQPPAVMVHGLADARLALSVGRPVTLLSAPGAGLYAGCGWWQALLRRVRAEFPAVAVIDILDCGEGAGQAMAALRVGQQHIVLCSAAPGWEAVAAIAEERGGTVLRAAPAALNMAERGAERRLRAWLEHQPTGDRSAPLG